MLTLTRLTLENADPLWFWFALAGLCVAVLVFTYRGIAQRSREKRLAWQLMALRMVGVAVLLIALVKPAWTSWVSQMQKPRLAVVIDDSQSMTISSLAGSAAETGTSPGSRYELAKRWWNQSPTAERLRERFEVSVFNVEGRSLTNQQFPGEPSAEQTDLVRAVQAVANRWRGQHVAGVVLISDGKDTTGRGDFLALQELPLAVYALGYANRISENDPSIDLAIANIEAPTRVMVHNAVPIRVLVSKDAGPALQTSLLIERAGSVVHTQEIALPTGPIQQFVTMQYTPDQAGDYVLTLLVPEQPSERVLSNNRKAFALRVEAEPIRVVYLEGILRNEYTFLRDRLSLDPDLDLVTFVRAANPDQVSAQTAALGTELITVESLKKVDVVLLGDFEAAMLDDSAYRTLKNWVEAGGGLMILAGYRNLGFGGLSDTPLAGLLPMELDPSQTVQIDEPFHFTLTEEGKRHPALLLTGETQRDAALWEALPRLRGQVGVSHVKPGATVLARNPNITVSMTERVGLPVLITQPFGKGHVVLLTADSTWLWSRLPRLMGAPDMLYARFWSQMIRWLAQRDVQSQRPALMVTTDLPSYPRGQRVQVRVQRNPAALVPTAEGAAEPTALKLSVRLPDGRLTDLPAQPSSSDPDLWTAQYFPDRGGRFEINAQLIPVGGASVTNHEAVADAVTATNEASVSESETSGGGGETSGGGGATQVTPFMVEGSNLELDDPQANPAALVQIARSTGGQFAELADEPAVQRMMEQLPDKPREQGEVQTAQLWRHPLWFIVFLALITTEWVIRRRHKMV